MFLTSRDWVGLASFQDRVPRMGVGLVGQISRYSIAGRTEYIPKTKEQPPWRRPWVSMERS
jgi:hypothetical protein